MSEHVLIMDASSILNSQTIQIIHKHPDFSHKKRTDLDPWKFIATSYPIALANKIIPFLNLPELPITPTRARMRSPKRQKSTSPARRTRSKTTESGAAETDNERNRSPRKRSPVKPSTKSNDQVTDAATPRKPTLMDLPTPYFTPDRSRNPTTTASPGTIDTIYTSRTTSPGGTLFSPLKPTSAHDIWSPLPLAVKHATTTIIPSSLFSPAKLPPTLIHQLPLPPLNIPNLAEIVPPQPRSRQFTFTAAPIILAHQVSLPTLTLRHNLSTSAIRDVFNWCHISVTAGHIVDLWGRLIHFRDTTRIREIKEVCLEFGLIAMAGKAEVLLKELEMGFGRRIKRQECEKTGGVSRKNQEKDLSSDEFREVEKMIEGDSEC